MSAVGCIEHVDPATSETLYRVDPNVVTSVEVGAETAVSIAAILGAIWPALLPIAGAGAGILGAWQRMKPKMLETQRRQDLYYATTEGIVAGVKRFGELHPDSYEVLKERLSKTIGPEAENVIRALRGLPAKM